MARFTVPYLDTESIVSEPSDKQKYQDHLDRGVIDQVACTDYSHI